MHDERENAPELLPNGIIVLAKSILRADPRKEHWPHAGKDPYRKETRDRPSKTGLKPKGYSYDKHPEIKGGFRYLNWEKGENGGLRYLRRKSLR